MPIETRHLKRGVAYRVVVKAPGRDAETVSRTFRSKAAAEAWEREMQQALGLAAPRPEDRMNDDAPQPGEEASSPPQESPPEPPAANEATEDPRPPFVRQVSNRAFPRATRPESDS